MANYHLFISHSWAHDDSYYRLVNLLKKQSNFHFKNFSVTKEDPIVSTQDDEALYTAIYNQIRPSSVVLILAGIYVSHSKWINQEIEIAKREFHTPKPIIAIRPRGQNNISKVVRQNADELVYWNAESVVAAVRKWG